MVKLQQILKKWPNASKQANNNKIDKEQNSSLQRNWTITSLVYKIHKSHYKWDHVFVKQGNAIPTFN